MKQVKSRSPPRRLRRTYDSELLALVACATAIFFPQPAHVPYLNLGLSACLDPVTATAAAGALSAGELVEVEGGFFSSASRLLPRKGLGHCVLGLDFVATLFAVNAAFRRFARGHR